jgi:outer membrane protein assembly factor BamB
MPLTHDMSTRIRRWMSVLLQMLALLSLAALLGACLNQPQTTFVRDAPVPAGMLFTYTARGQDAWVDVLVGARGRDGAPRWRTNMGRRINAPPLVLGATAYAEGETLPTATAGQAPGDAVLALRVSDGALLWRSHLPTASLTLTVDATSVLAATSDDGLYALDPASGAIRWHRAVPLSPYQMLGQPRAAAGAVLAVGRDMGVAAFREGDGAPLWAGQPGGISAINQTTLFGNIGFDIAYARSLATGRELWEYESARKVNGLGVAATVLAADDHTVLLRTDRGLAGLDAASGALLWESPATFDGTYVVAGGATPTFFGGHGGRLLAVRASDGAVLWQTAIQSYTAGSATSMAVAEDALFAMLEGPPCFTGGCLPNRLVALDATSGALAWWRDLPDAYLLAQAP